MSLAAFLRRDATAPPETVDVPLVEAAVAHGVAPLLYRALRDAGVWTRVSPDARARLAQIARESVIVESVRAEHLRRLVDALDGEGVRPLLFKGAALAASHYPEPWLRIRSDSDLLVRDNEIERTARVLERFDFVRVPRPAGALLTQQLRYEGRENGVALAYDVHRRIADPHAFAAALPYNELAARAIADHPSGARRASDVDALAISCVHRAAHHYDTDHLLPIYDIYLIATPLTDGQWQDFARLAEVWRLRTVFRRGLELASETFGLQVPCAAQDSLAGGHDEPTRIFVNRRIRRLDVLLSDLQSLPTWSDRIRLVKSHVFPGASYLAATAPAGARPISPLHRALKGARSWWRPL